MRNKTKIYVAKYTIYTAVLVLLYVLQTTPGFLSLFGVKPNLVVAAAVCIAMCDGEFVGGIFGAAAGVLCDLGAPSLFGFHAIILLAACVLVGLGFIYLLRITAVNFIFVLTLVLLLQGMIDFLLNYAMWGYQNVSTVLVRSILPGVAYSVAVGPLLYYLYRWIFGRFQEKILG